MFFTRARLRLYLGGLLVFQIASIVLHVPAALGGITDFRTFYTTGRMVQTHQSHLLYDYQAELNAQNALISRNDTALPFMFPPYAALLFLPFAAVNFKTAYWIFFALNVGLCTASAALMRPYCPMLRARWSWLLPLLFLSFLPLGRALENGQVSILLLCLYCACFAALQSGRTFVAGLLLSFALIKFQIALPIFLLFLIWRQWRFVGGFLSGATALALVSLGVTGPRLLFAYLHSLLFMAGQTSQEVRYAMFSGEMPNLYGFFHTFLPGYWGYVATIIFSLAVLVWAATRKPSLPLALLAAMLVSFHLYPYDLALLLLPISLVFEAELASGSRDPVNWLGFYASGFMVLLPFSWPFISINFRCLFVIPVAALFLSSRQTGLAPTADAPSAPHAEDDQAAGSQDLIPGVTATLMANCT